jgi:DNA-binding CsgD family transcriptional regulator
MGRRKPGSLLSSPSSKPKTVCVIGQLYLQNELITRRLQSEIGVKCLAAESLDEARSRFGEDFEQTALFLWDCAEKDLTSEMRGLDKIGPSLPSACALGLFNVKMNSWGDGIRLPARVKGVIFEEGSTQDFIAGISCMLDGKRWLPVDQPVRDPVAGGTCVGAKDTGDQGLTPREKLILSFIQEGKSNQQIADVLGIKYKTIKNHINKLFKKINVSNRDQAARWAKRHTRR